MARKPNPAVDLACLLLMVVFLALAGIGCFLSGSYMGLSPAFAGTSCKVLHTSIRQETCTEECHCREVSPEETTCEACPYECFPVDVKLGWDCKEDQCRSGIMADATGKHRSREEAESKAQEQFAIDSMQSCLVPDLDAEESWGWLREPVRVLGLVTMVFTGVLILAIIMEQLENRTEDSQESERGGSEARPASNILNPVKA